MGTAGAERIAGLVQHLIERDPAAALADLDQSVTQGVDVGQLLDQLLGYFRDIMAAAVGCPAGALINVAPGDRPAVESAAKQLGLETVLAILQILDQTLSRLKTLTYPRTLAELALVRICKLEDLDSLPQIISQLRDGSIAGPASRPARRFGRRSQRHQSPLPHPTPRQKKTSLSSK